MGTGLSPFAEARAIVGDILDDASKDIESHMCRLIDEMLTKHRADVSALIDALNSFHTDIHGGDHALVMCPVPPCNTVYDVIRGAHRGE